MYATDHFERQLLNSMRGVTLAAPAAMYLALFLTNPTESGQAGTEVSYDGYQRVPITFSPPTASANGMSIQNDTQITFPTAGLAAGTIAYIGVMDSITGGNMWLYGELATPLNMLKDVAPIFTVGSIKYTSSGALTNAYKTKHLNVLRGQSISGYNLYMALFNGDPENGGAELSGVDYARVALELTAPTEADSGQMFIENSVLQSFPTPTTAWGTWSYTALYNAASGGQPVWKYPQSPSWELKAGRMPTIDQGGVKIALN